MKVGDDYNQHWEEKFSSREWGRYPPEDLVRFMGRNFRQLPRAEISVLEIGCGPGANIWFLHREGYRVAGIDGSATAIQKAAQRIDRENHDLNPLSPDLQVGNFVSLPWEDCSFDVVVDIFALYANTAEVIDQALSQVFRVLKPGGRFYSKMWGTNTSGYKQGREIEPYTFDDILHGPCFNMGVTHFFDEAEIKRKFEAFDIELIDRLIRTDATSDSHIEELVCQCSRPIASV